MKISGRGAPNNVLSKRFQLPEREEDGDWLDARDEVDGEPPKLRTSVFVEKPKTIITRNSSPDIAFDRSINVWFLIPHTKRHAAWSVVLNQRGGSSDVHVQFA